MIATDAAKQSPVAEPSTVALRPFARDGDDFDMALSGASAAEQRLPLNGRRRRAGGSCSYHYDRADRQRPRYSLRGLVDVRSAAIDTQVTPDERRICIH